MDPELKKKFEAFRTTVSATAEDIVFKTFPKKILELQAMLETTSSSSSNFHMTHATSFTDVTVYPPPSKNEEPEGKKRKRSGDRDSVDKGGNQVNATEHARYPNLMLANKHIVKVHEDLKRECEELVQLCDKVKLWVNLTMPKIEDGDNFGVQIQEEALSELHRSQESAFNLRDTSRQHHLNRAKICSKIIKYPNIEDYSIALREHDEKQLYLARQHLFDLRNIYAVLTDILNKNIGKIRAPKNNNGIALY